MSVDKQYLGSRSNGAIPEELQVMIYSDKTLTTRDLESLECTCSDINRIMKTVWNLKAIKALPSIDPFFKEIGWQDNTTNEILPNSDGIREMIKRYQQAQDKAIGHPCIGDSWGKYFFRSQVMFPETPKSLISALGGHQAAVNIPVLKIQNSHFSDVLSYIRPGETGRGQHNVFIDIRPGEMEYPIMRFEYCKRMYFALKCIIISTEDTTGQKYVLIIDKESTKKDKGFNKFFGSQYYFVNGKKLHIAIKRLVDGKSLSIKDFSVKGIKDKRYPDFNVQFYRKHHVQLLTDRVHVNTTLG